MEKVVINVSGMNCGHCKMSVEKELNGIDGVSVAEVNLEAKNVSVEFEGGKVTVDQLKEAIDDIGFEAE